MQETISEIILNQQIRGPYWKLVLKTGWQDYKPGQFLMLEIPGNESFLRRPFGIASLKNGEAEICYKVVGKGTRRLTDVKPGTKTSVLGPIGNGFNLSESNGSINYLIAGGYGIAPLFGLAQKLKTVAGSSTHLFYGAKGKDDLLYVDEILNTGVSIHLTTEDGSRGEKGLITDILKKFLQITNHDSRVTVYACGPHPMLKTVASIFPDSQLSLESFMGCGMGVCMGCAVKTKDGNFVRVCKEGPVFKAGSVVL